MRFDERFLEEIKARLRPSDVIGRTVRLRQKLAKVERRAGGLQLTNECTIEIEGETRPACVAETVAVLFNK